MIEEFLQRVRSNAHVMVLGNVGVSALQELVDRGRSGLLVTDLSAVGVQGLEMIQARIGHDPCMVKMIDGYWLRPITLPEIINQLPGPYDAVISCLHDRDRMVAQSETLKAMYPQALAYPEDGNNDGVVAEYRRRGYRSEVTADGWLILWRPS